MLLASADVYRPQAREQLAVLGERAGADTLSIIEGEKPFDIIRRALKAAAPYDALILDTAGRVHVDNEMMREISEIKKISSP